MRRTGMWVVGLGCLLVAAQASAGERIKVKDEGGIRDAWNLAPGTQLVVPPYPPEHAANKADVCVAVGYLIGKDGTTSEFSMLKSWSSTKPAGDGDAYWGAFARYASAALSQWRFAPKPEVADPKPVYTVATFVFSDRPTAELRGKCAIPSLQMHLLELRNDPRMGRRMSRGIFAQLEIDPLMEQKYWALRRASNEATAPKPIPAPRPTPPPKP